MYSLVLKQVFELAGIPTLSGCLFIYSYNFFNIAVSSLNYMTWNDKETNEKSVWNAATRIIRDVRYNNNNNIY